MAMKLGSQCLFEVGVAGLLLAVTTGCSSGTTKPSAVAPTSGPTASSPMTAAPADGAFQTKAGTVCQTTVDQMRVQGPFPFPDYNPASPDASKFPTIAAYEAKTVANIQTFQTNLVGLGQPANGQSAWSTFLKAVDRFVQLTVAQQDAAGRNDSAAFTQTYKAFLSQRADAQAAAVAAGVPPCDPYSLSR